MSPKFFNRLFVSLALVAAIGCSRSTSAFPEPGAERIAIFPIENLSGRPELLAASRALPVLIEYQLTGLAGLTPVIVASPSEAAAKHTLRELRGYLEVSGTKLSLKLQDRLAGGKIDRVIHVSEASLARISDRVAHQISPQARPLPEINSEGLDAFASGLANLGTPASIEHFRRATQLAPGFGPAWRYFGNALWSLGRQPEAVAAWQSALSAKLDPVSHARIRADLASKTKSPDLESALVALTKLLPADLDLHTQAGELLSNSGNYAEAVPVLKAAASLEPTNGAIRNTLAYSQAMIGDYPAAITSISAYAQLEPANPNPIDSKGEIEFLTRHFADAARTFESLHSGNPNFQQGLAIRKAAEAYLLAGDSASANRVAAKWIATAPPNTPVGERFTAVWEHRTGKRAEGIERLVRIAPQDPLAANQVIIWLLQAGDRTRAAALAATIQSPAAALMAFLSQPSAPGSTWAQRAAAITNPQQSRAALVYALALDSRWADLAQLLTPDAPRMTPLRSAQTLALYRRALEKSGRAPDAKKLPDFPVLPTQDADSLFDSLIYVP